MSENLYRRLRVGVDLDGVGYYFGLSVWDHLTTEGIHVEKPTDVFCTNWNFHDAWGMDRDEFEHHCNEGVDAGIVFGPGEHLTRPNFFDTIKHIKGMGHEIVIITHRYQGSPGNAELNTYKWLIPVMDYIDEIHFSADKTSVKTDIFVEDNKNNYDALTAAGTPAVLINRPWNLDPGDSRLRINDISEYPAVVDLLSNFPEPVV